MKGAGRTQLKGKERIGEGKEIRFGNKKRNAGEERGM